MFLRFKSPRTSSGAVKQVFNYDGINNTAKRNRMSPQVLSQIVLLKANDVFEAQEGKIRESNNQK